MPRIAFATLGCKINQVDTAHLEKDFAAAGYQIVDWPGPAEVYVVNTCTVTARADRQSRQMVYRARRANPDALVVVTGCGPISGGGKTDAYPDADLITGNVEKHEMVQLVEHHRTGETERVIGDVAGDHSIVGSDAALISGRVRAFVKVQNGCPANCAYCIIPSVRGPSRSVPVDTVMQTIGDLLAMDQQEIVLTGIHLGAYGADLSTPTDIAALCREILEQTEIPRLRLSSIEPLEVGDDLLEVMAADSRFCHHLHIPLQSGCDRILRLMNRPYDVSSYEKLADKCRQQVPDITLGADLMVGFPGETENDFAETMETLTRLQLPHVHVFPYSDRPGTAADAMKEKTPSEVTSYRAAQVRELCRSIQRGYRRAQIGRRLLVLVEQIDGKSFAKGKSRNYLPIKMAGSPPLGSELPVRIVALTDDDELVGEVEKV